MGKYARPYKGSFFYHGIGYSYGVSRHISLQSYYLYQLFIRFKKVAKWVPVNLAHAAEQPVYDSHDKSVRRLVQIDDLDLTSEDGREINIFDEDGYRIPRRTTLHRRSCSSSGLLLDLSNTHTLFQSLSEREPVDDDDDDNSIFDFPNKPDVKMTVYPQAFLRRYGNVQANGPPLGFIPVINNLNRTLVSNADADRPAVRIVAFQGYNHVQHNLAERAGQIEVVQGRITAVLAGTRANTPSAKRAFTKIRDSASHYLPHERVEEKLSKDDMARSMRFEIVVAIDIDTLKPENQSGGYVLS